MSDDNTKKEVMKLIEQIKEKSKKLNEIHSKRRAATEKYDKECENLHVELETLREKKRLLMCEMVDGMVGY